MTQPDQLDLGENLPAAEAKTKPVGSGTGCSNTTRTHGLGASSDAAPLRGREQALPTAGAAPVGPLFGFHLRKARRLLSSYGRQPRRERVSDQARLDAGRGRRSHPAETAPRPGPSLADSL